MPLFDGVYWIASEGHTKTVDGSAWDEAVQLLITALKGRGLPATGTLRGTNTPQKVSADHWQGVVGDRLNTEPYLLLIGPAGEHDLNGGMYQDQLFMVDQQQVSKWWQLAVEQSDIRRLWPTASSGVSGFAISGTVAVLVRANKSPERWAAGVDASR